MRKFVLLLTLVLAMVLAACAAPPATPTTPDDSGQATEPTEAPAEEPTEAPAEEPTEAPAEEPTEAPAEEPTEEMPTMEDMGALSMEGDLLTLDAGGCDYGGKFASITAVDKLTVQFTMCSPDPAFPAKVAFEGFGIQPMEHIIATGGTGDLLETPIGTGPYKLDTWNRGDSIVLSANETYWGDAPADAQMVIRWATEGPTRLVELQSAQVDQIAFPSPEDYETISGDDSLTLLPSNNPNIFYVGLINTVEPFNDPLVRQALAMGIDRQRIVDTYYPEGSEAASHFTPCSIPGGCEGEEWYEFDVEAARALLEEAGVGEGFSTKIFYRDVFRVYLPEPGAVAVDLQTQLKENLNIDAEVVVMESGEFLEASSAGALDGIYLLGWGADYPHPTNFLDYHFGEANPQFGDPHPEIYEALSEASQSSDEAVTAPLYETANNAIRELVPMIPIAHGAAAEAARADAEGAHTRPFGAVIGSIIDTPDDVYVYMGSAEPISLYCADETDGETFRACGQIVESLLAYGLDSGDTEPALATECTSNEDATEWTCALREGVVFHDGSEFDANDVVFQYAVGLDASNPYHVGNTGVFEYWSYLWGLMNAPE
jgi:peptide/nickel transport system substrate-binding protein